MKRELPPIIQQVGFDFEWDNRKVWALDVPAEPMHVSELAWHFDVPFIWTKPDGYYDVTPREVMEHPERFPEEYDRTMRADTSYPIDIMHWRQRWLILDGLHRLMRLAIEGSEEASVRIIPQSAIPQIQK